MKNVVVDKEQAVKIIHESRNELAETYGVRKIGLFGSIVRGEQTATSDIDIVVEIASEKKKLHNFLSFRRYLEHRLGRSVDLGIESTVKPIVREAIAKEIVYVQ